LIRKLALTGQMRAGKDTVAKECGYTVVGTSDPMYAICRGLVGTDDKKIPGIRELMQRIGQWGWGLVSQDYPMSPERASFVRMIQTQGDDIARIGGFVQKVDWRLYGKDQRFWINIAIKKIDNIINSSNTSRVAVTNCRFQHELAPLISSEDPGRPGDESEKLALELNDSYPLDKVIWTGASSPTKEGPYKCHSLESFKELAQGGETQPIDPGDYCAETGFKD
jgi:hypothetical protein